MLRISAPDSFTSGEGPVGANGLDAWVTTPAEIGGAIGVGAPKINGHGLRCSIDVSAVAGAKESFIKGDASEMLGLVENA